MVAGCQSKGLFYYDVENFEAVTKMAFNTSAVKEIQFYDKEEFEFVEWAFFGCDDYIRLVNCERNDQANIYSVPHDTLHDLRIDYSSEILS